MANINPSIPPGAYFDNQTLTLSFGPEVTGVAITKNTAPPSISKYIAYDDLDPPKPFLAVTEDGRGRVVYDSGFPKFYNGMNPHADTFATLTAAGKYLYNSLKWIANPDKVAAGNKKVLFLGDTINEADTLYNIKGDGPDGFRITFENICALDGFVPTFMNLEDYTAFDNGFLNPGLGTLESYCAVVLVSSNSLYNIPRITSQAVSALVTYRENGNGIVIITDHGRDLFSIEDKVAVNPGDFFLTANAVAYHFGTYFTGSYDRSSVNVGYLRANYGDHPLYNGMTDTESIYAGPSESMVVVTETALVPPGNVQPITIDDPGINYINILVKLNDGSIVTQRLVYNIQGDEFLFIDSLNPDTGLIETNGGFIYADLAGKCSIAASIDATTLGDVWGEIIIKGWRAGELHAVGANSSIYWNCKDLINLQLRNGETVDFVIKSPFTYTKSFTVKRKEMDIANNASLGKLLNEAQAIGLYDDNSEHSVALNLKKVYTAVNALFAANRKQALSIKAADYTKLLYDLATNRLQFSDIITDNLYKDLNTMLAAVAAAGAAQPGRIFIDAVTKKVYGYLNGTYQQIRINDTKDVFGAPRTVTSTAEGISLSYFFDVDGSISLL